MANITGFNVGRLTGTSWVSGMNTSDLTALGSGNTIMSALTFANDAGGNFDQLCKISVKLVIPSTTLAAGACVAVWLAEQLDDLTNYGDGQLTAGSQSTHIPTWEPLAIITATIGSVSTVWGVKSNLLLPPSTFSFVMQNNLGVNITSGTLKFITGDINTNL